MPPKVLNPVLTALKSAVIVLVVAWILNIPGMLQLPLFTEQMLVAVLGLSLALIFLMFPLDLGVTGEEAVVAKALPRGVLRHELVEHGLTSEESRVGALDVVLAVASLVACFYVAARYPELIKELTARPWYGVLVASVIVLLVFE